MDFNLTDEEIKFLKSFHKKVKDRKIADKVKCVVALAQGFSFEDIANILLIDERTARRYFDTYKKEGLEKLCTLKYYQKKMLLSQEQIKLLKEELRNNCYSYAKEIKRYIEKTFKIKYTVAGLVILLHRIGFVYKKTKVVPARCDIKLQKDFLEKYQKLRENTNKNIEIFFMDGVHATYNTISSYAWIEKGQDKTVKSNTARERININGVYSPISQDIVVSSSKKLDAVSIVNFIKRLEKKYSDKEKIYLICDNARYYKSKLLREYLPYSKIEMLYLPSYSPNLNLIERLWKLMKKKILYNRYHESYQSFCNSLLNFLRKKSNKWKRELSIVLAENFHLFEN